MRSDYISAKSRTRTSMDFELNKIAENKKKIINKIIFRVKYTAKKIWN